MTGHHAHHHNHQHDHTHDHGHGHSHVPTDVGRAFVIGIVLNSLFVVVEFVYGVLAGSLALIADAGHNLSDVLGLVLAWIASVLTKQAASKRRTYGWQRSSILAALFNAILLLVSVGAIAWEAVQRLQTPTEIAAQTVMWVALVGIVINTATALLFMSGRQHDLNIRGAFLHMVADAAISAGVVLAAIIIAFTGWQWLDPVTSLVIAAIIVAGTTGLLRDSLNLSLDAVPAHINPDAVMDYFTSLSGVADAHHLHIWGLSTTEVALTVHLLVTDAQDNDLLQQINEALRSRFGISHVTIQFERYQPAHLSSQHAQRANGDPRTCTATGHSGNCTIPHRS